MKNSKKVIVKATKANNQKNITLEACRFATSLFSVGVVENIGLEPMTSCMPCKRSSQLS